MENQQTPSTAETPAAPTSPATKRGAKKKSAPRKKTSRKQSRPKRRAATRKSAGRKRATRKQGRGQMARTSSRFPAQVLSAAKKLLSTPAFRNILMSGSNGNGTGRSAAPSVRTTKSAAKSAKSARGGSSSGSRGRIAGFYFPRTKSLKDANENTTKVFNYIKSHRKSGATQKAIQDGLKLPHSTVWYALVNLRAAKAVNYKQPKAA